MKERWFGDDRDLVKWSALLHVARDRKLSRIIQVAYLREDARPAVVIDQETIRVDETVWKFFRDLRRVRTLGDVAGIPIEIIADVFDPRTRATYRDQIRTAIRRGAPGAVLLFLDPDTGLQPGRAGPEHVTRDEVRAYWEELQPGDWLALYQHARHTKTWRTDVAAELEQICGAPIIAAASIEIGKDVALLFAEKR